MVPFMNEEFLLTTQTARALFHGHAQDCPIIDYHNHLPARDIFERRKCENLTQLWLEADHYKWRAMRVCGVPEYYVTGNAPEKEKFLKFAEVMPRLIGAPVYHWAHMELQRYFDITTPLTGETAEEIWNTTVEMLKGEGFDSVSLLEKQMVKVLCTTDDPVDDLYWHRAIAQDGSFPFLVLPSFRPDRFMNIDQSSFSNAVEELAEQYGEITNWESLQKALVKALDYFVLCECRVTDHGFLHFRYGRGNVDGVVEKALRGEPLTEEEIANYQGAFLRFVAREYKKRDLVMQLHLGPIRNNSPKLRNAFGPDAGGDSIGEATDPFLLGAFLSDLEGHRAMPKIILYNLNPCDSAMMATMAVNFAADGAKVQYGAAWWLLDHLRGISDQIDQLMETGLLSGSVGMLTDSRSFTSFPRHEYFRRILCRKLGEMVEQGLYPADMKTLGALVEDICWKNAVNYFGFEI